MSYNIHATCKIGQIVSRRIQPQRAVKQARDYRRRGFTAIRIVELEGGREFDANSLAQELQLAVPSSG